ncbi:MAG: cupin domain-containing protein [Halobacteriales archaeon]
MSYTKLNYADVESKAGLYFLREELDCENLGVSVIDVEDGREGPAHDHADGDQEEVYVLVEGAARLTVDDEELRLQPGDSVRVEPEVTRQLTLEGDSQMVIVGAP